MMGCREYLHSSVCLHKFIYGIPYKSDEIAHVAFPDERYNKPKLTTTCRLAEMEFETLHICNEKFLWDYCERSHCVKHALNLHESK